MRVWAISDIHTDYPDNLKWCENLSLTEYQPDALVVAGDVSDDLEILHQTLSLLRDRWAHVFYTFGNHELWVRRGQQALYDSLGKWEKIKDICNQLDVRWQPACLHGIWIVPIISWYHASWDREPDLPNTLAISKVMMDFHACHWPSHLGDGTGTELARHFDQQNDQTLAEVEAQIATAAASGGQRPLVISFSHYLPFQDLLPEKRMLNFANLSKAVGSDYLGARVRKLKPAAHVFGHTHFAWDSEIDGTRYVQWPLGYPRRRSIHGSDGQQPLLLFDNDGQASPQQDAYWSQHYQQHRRDPGNLQPAPWVH